MRKIVVILIALASLLAAQDAERIREHTRFLSLDLLEGRGVGQRGGDLATEYIATQFALAGAKPAGDNGTWFQKVPLVGIETQLAATLSASAGGKSFDFRWLDDFVGVSQTQRPETRFEGEAVFVGHGITAPEYKWDDFKGVDVANKILVLFTNEPTSTDPKFFDGRALTYYGRWSYKYEEGLRHGARGVIIIHTTPTAGYGWDVVRSSWGRETPYVKLGADGKALSLAGWITRDAGEKLLALAGKTVDELLAASEKPGFQPIPLGIRIRGNMPAKIRELNTRNVAAIVPGSDPVLKNEAVIFSAHWDHLGIGTPVNGDSIYNGAIDNGTGCAILMELARAWAALPQKPKRSALFLSVTAEEGGLEGIRILRRASPDSARQDRHRPQLRRPLPLGPRQGCGLDRRRADHRLAAGPTDRPAAEPEPSLPTPSRSRATTSAPTISRSRMPECRRSPSATPPNSPASPQATARRCGRTTTPTTTTTPPTNSTPTGISPPCSKPPNTVFYWGAT